MPWTKFYIEKNEPGFFDQTDNKGRKLSYGQAIHEAIFQAMEYDNSVFVMGQGVDDPYGMFGTTSGLKEKFGENRVFDTPLSENAMTGIAIGAAIRKMKPIYVHNRPDFLLLAMDQIVNHASKWYYTFGGKGFPVPLIIRAVIGRGWGSGPQHSQSLHGLFMHIPGLRLIMPATAYDAKGLLISSIADNNPVIFLEHRWLYKHESIVPEEMYSIPLGKGIIRCEGKDVTIVAISYMVIEALRAAEELKKEGISAEIIDPRTLLPLDKDLIIQSVKKTRRLVLADLDWKTNGVTAEIGCIIAETCPDVLKAPLIRVTEPDCPTPSGFSLEEKFYPGVTDIIKAVKEVLKK